MYVSSAGLGDVCFVGSGRINDHHCLNFLFIIVIPRPVGVTQL